MSQPWAEKFGQICSLSHSEQAKYWLNGFWVSGAEQYADELWTTCHQFIECELGEPVRYGGRMKEYKEGCDLDELKSHVVLETMGETLTVVELRQRLAKLDVDNNKRLALSEYLLDKYNKTPQELTSSPQPDVDPAKLKAAEDAFAAAEEALNVASDEKESARKALLAAKTAASEAARRLEAAKAAAEEAAQALVVANRTREEADQAHKRQEAAEAEVKAAEAEVQAAVDEITALEKVKADKIAALQAIIDDDSQGTVKKGRAVNEKAQLEGEDELPLRKAKITQTAALKRVAKAVNAATEATAAAANVLRKADNAKAASAKAKSAADEAEAMSREAKAEADRKETESAAAKDRADAAHEASLQAIKEAEAQLEEIKNSSGPPYGPIYWMERTLKEKKKFMK